MSDTLKLRQTACAGVEAKMMQHLLQFDGIENLKVSYVKWIARVARNLAFDATGEVVDGVVS